MNIINFLIAAGGAVGFAVLMWLAYIGGRGYSVTDAQSHASDYAGEMKEGHGGMTALLWVSFVAAIAWSIYYFVIHWSEFGAMSMGGGH